MKHIAIFLICVFFLLSGSARGQQWEKYTAPDYTANVMYAFAVVQGTPFAVLFDGLYRGNASGTQWEKIRDFDIVGLGYYFFEVNYEKNVVYFNTGIDSSGFYSVYESADLGKTWTELDLFPGLNNALYDLAFIGDTLYTYQYNNVFSKFGPEQPQVMDAWP
ncbi:MAG: hypothetical protein KDD14_13285, partial [Saprospiraceae bacterium]|nr:hypothetical protein [Saprospiraceae bacterium]